MTTSSPGSAPSVGPAASAPGDRPADSGTKPALSGRETKAALATATTVVLWASAFVAIRGAGRHLQPGPMALLRLLTALVVLGAMTLRRREPLPARRDLVSLGVAGVLWYGLYNVFLNASERRLDAGTSAMLIGIGPILIALIAGVALRDGLPRALRLGLPVSFAGVVLIAVGSSGGSGSGGQTVAVTQCVAAAVAYAVAVVVQKPVLARVPPLQATFLCCAAGTIVCLPFAPELVHEVGTAPASALGWTVYLGLLPTAVAFTTWAYALARVSAGRLAATTYIVPPLSILLGWLALGETPGLVAVGGGVLCLAGVAVSRRRPGAGRPAASVGTSEKARLAERA